MGVDICAFCEKRNKETGKWEFLSLYKKKEDGLYEPSDVYDGRDYDLFGLLAGVRGQSGFFVAPRGIPDDLSDVVAEIYGDGEFWFSATWYDYCELNAYEYMLTDSMDYIRRKNKKIKELESQIKLLEQKENYDDELELLDDDYDEYYDGKYNIADSLKGFMDSIRYVLDAYDIRYPLPGEVRIVMWFNC